MYFDDEMLKTILNNLGLSDFETNEFILEHKNNMFELIMMKVFNHYAANNNETEIKALEESMHKAAKEGDIEEQKTVMQIFTNTIVKYPELTDEIKQMLAEIHSEMFFDYMEKADHEEQMEILTYMLRKKREVKETGKTFDKYKRKQKLLSE